MREERPSPGLRGASRGEGYLSMGDPINVSAGNPWSPLGETLLSNGQPVQAVVGGIMRMDIKRELAPNPRLGKVVYLNKVQSNSITSVKPLILKPLSLGAL